MAKLEFLENQVKEQFRCKICGMLEDIPHTHTAMELMMYFQVNFQMRLLGGGEHW